MKRLSLLMICGVFLLFFGCEYKNEEELFGEKEACGSPVMFADDIEQLIQTNCALAGCHAAGGVFPELSSYEKIKASASKIKQMTQTLQMPPPSTGKSLTQEQIDHLACWVEQGAPNN